MAKPNFVPGYEVSQVSPVPHYYEEILPHLRLLDQIGFRGDRNYLFYSKDELGKAMYEVEEKRLSAEATYKRLSEEKYRQQYFSEVEELLGKVKAFLDKLNGRGLSALSDPELNEQLLAAYEIEAMVFAYFIACQPFRTVLFEDEIKAELRKRVALERLDSYLAELAVSEKPTRMSLEEIDWLKLEIENFNALNGLPDKPQIEILPGELKAAVEHHFGQYKILTLGDGVWEYDIEVFVKRLDRTAALDDLQKRLNNLGSAEQATLKKRKKLIEELYLPQATVETIDLLAELGYYRFLMRTEGFIPLIFACISMRLEICARRGIKDPLSLVYLEPDEFKDFLDGKLDLSERKKPEHEEFLYFIEDGKPHLVMGEEAGKKFKEMAPPEDVSHVTEVKGSPAMRGVVQGRVCLYNWGDDLDERLGSMKENKILVAGHTRPAMMPLIRQANGIVTDEGGVTSHAAIVSRELGLPSVINTRNATKVFKEGDLVELDADHGVVRKIG